jgi:hypothetical protein
LQEVNLWKLMGDFNLHGLTSPGKFSSSLYIMKTISISELEGMCGARLNLIPNALVLRLCRGISQVLHLTLFNTTASTV